MMKPTLLLATVLSLSVQAKVAKKRGPASGDSRYVTEKIDFATPGPKPIRIYPTHYGEQKNHHGYGTAAIVEAEDGNLSLALDAHLLFFEGALKVFKGTMAQEIPYYINGVRRNVAVNLDRLLDNKDTIQIFVPLPYADALERSVAFKVRNLKEEPLKASEPLRMGGFPVDGKLEAYWITGTLLDTNAFEDRTDLGYRSMLSMLSYFGPFEKPEGHTVVNIFGAGGMSGGPIVDAQMRYVGAYVQSAQYIWPYNDGVGGRHNEEGWLERRFAYVTRDAPKKKEAEAALAKSKPRIDGKELPSVKVATNYGDGNAAFVKFDDREGTYLAVPGHFFAWLDQFQHGGGVRGLQIVNPNLKWLQYYLDGEVTGVNFVGHWAKKEVIRNRTNEALFVKLDPHELPPAGRVKVWPVRPEEEDIGDEEPLTMLGLHLNTNRYIDVKGVADEKGAEQPGLKGFGQLVHIKLPVRYFEDPDFNDVQVSKTRWASNAAGMCGAPVIDSKNRYVGMHGVWGGNKVNGKVDPAVKYPTLQFSRAYQR